MVMTFATVNWEAVAAITGAVGVIIVPVFLYTLAALKQNNRETRGWVSEEIKDATGILAGRLDRMDQHLDIQDTVVGDVRERLARLEGSAGLSRERGYPRPPDPPTSQRSRRN